MMPSFARVTAMFLIVGAAGAAGCSSSAESPPPPEPCADIAVDRFKELAIVDSAVIDDARARNATGGAWSFRYAVENMARTPADGGEFVRRWFTEWVTLTNFNSYALDRENRAGLMSTRLLCPWFRRTAENQCNADCSACAVNPPKVDLATAPFRLIAIVNRMDVRDEAATGPYGEGRLVFAMTDGPSDDPASVALPMTVNFEYNLPPSRSLKATAEAWHALGKHGAFDEAYRSELQTVTDSFVKRGANPSRPNGNAIGQVRTNESALNWVWQLRQFELGPDGDMHLSAVKNNAAEALNNSSALKRWVTENATSIKANKYLLPREMLSGSADQLVFRWTLDGIDKDLRTAFVKGTCNGCHSDGVASSVDVAFHVSPFRQGVAKLSPFMNNPDDPAHDDLARRSTRLRSTLCAP